MGKIVQVKPGYVGVTFEPYLRSYSAGEQVTLTDAEYAAQPTSITNAVTIIQSGVADPVRSTTGAVVPLNQFTPETYGAKGDGRFVTDAAMTSGQATLACTTSTPFQSTDVGKYVLVWGAGSGGGFLFTTISAFTDSGHVTLAANASATVSAKGAVFGTDDTVAVQAAINAATTYSLTGSGKVGQVNFRDAIYCIASTATKGGSTAGNSALTLPVISATSGIKARINLKGIGASGPIHWTQPQPIQHGTVLLGMRIDGSLDATWGPTCVLGGPTNGYGGGGGNFSNMHLYLDGITVEVPYSTTPYAGVDLWGIGQATIGELSYMPIAVVPNTSTAWPFLQGLSGANIPSYTFGLRMPTVGNNAVADIYSFTCYFAQIGLVPAEHTNWQSLKTVYCQFGLLPMGGSGTDHGFSGTYWTCEATPIPIGSVSSGYFSLNSNVSMNILRLSLETYTTIVSDGAARMFGTVNFDDLNSPGTLYGSSLYANANVGIKLLHMDGGISAAPSQPTAPASGTAQSNFFYRDATIYLSATTSITAISVDSTALGLTAGAAGVVAIRVPSGHSFTVTYTGTLTTKWVLE